MPCNKNKQDFYTHRFLDSCYCHTLTNSFSKWTLWGTVLQADKLCIFASSQELFMKNMSFNSSALNPNQYSSPNKQNCGGNCHLRQAEWGCYSSRRREAQRAGFPTKKLGETGPAVPCMKHAGSSGSQLIAFQVCTISIFSAAPNRLGEEPPSQHNIHSASIPSY